MKFNQFGLITQLNLDSGDTCARHFEARFICEIRDKVLDIAPGIDFPNDPEQDLRWLEVNESGDWIRSPEPQMFWSDPNRQSRDQVIPLVAYLGIRGDHDRLKRWMRKMLQRYLFCQNKTDSFFFHLPLYWRGRGLWFLYPMVFIWDFFVIFTVLNRIGVLPRWVHEKRNFKKLDADDVGDDRNLLIQFAQAKLKYPTPIMWLCRKIYFKFRPHSYGSVLLQALITVPGIETNDEVCRDICKAYMEAFKEPLTHPVYGALLWYSRPSANGNLEQSKLWWELILWMK